MPETWRKVEVPGPIERADLDFRLRGYTGVVRVELSVNDDPVRLGHPLVAKNFDAVKFVGFPVLKATIDYPGPGLNAAMGWIQVIRHYDLQGNLGDVATDRFPLGPEDSPLYTYGYLPTFFDAPANPDHPDGDWSANAWLVALPDIIRTRRIAPLVGFRWGYRLRGAAPTLLELERLSESDWVSLLPQLRSEHPRWEFLGSISA